MNRRPRTLGQIEYLLIPRSRPEGTTSFVPPPLISAAEFRNFVSFPKNFLQLIDPVTYYASTKSNTIQQPMRLGVVYPDDISFYIRNDPYKSSGKVLLLDTRTENLQAIIRAFTESYRLLFLHFTDETSYSPPESSELCVKNGADFIENVRKRLPLVKESLNNENLGISFEIGLFTTPQLQLLNKASGFLPAWLNAQILNQIIGTYWVDDKVHYLDVDPAGDSKVNMLNPNDPTRLTAINEKIVQIDKLELYCLKERIKAYPKGTLDFQFSPLIMVVPFNFPHLKRVLQKSVKNSQQVKWLTKVLYNEQTLSYANFREFENKEIEGDMTDYAAYSRAKNTYLDWTAYLHSSFNYSPIFRFPHVGNSLKKELSFFNVKSLSQNILKNGEALTMNFGRKLFKRILVEGIAKSIFGKPRQLVCISDLPIEWLIVEEEYLCFTHDVTRIPETPYGGILSSFTYPVQISVTIPKNLLENTLVVMATKGDDVADEEMTRHFDFIELLAKELKFKTHRCQGIQDLQEQIMKLNPTFLIFDCHGGYDAENLSSYLIINKDRLTGKEIIDRRIVAPLIFLSACNTYPTYGYVNNLADAFFEAGCAAITATYFPVSVSNANNLYRRILTNLQIAGSDGIHKNWLEFVCHNIRTSAMSDMHLFLIRVINGVSFDETSKAEMMEKVNAICVKTLTELMDFTKRKGWLKRFKEQLAEILPANLIRGLDKLVPEFFYYTNMGRGDLIMFETWSEKFDSLNK